MQDDLAHLDALIARMRVCQEREPGRNAWNCIVSFLLSARMFLQWEARRETP